MLSMLTQKPDVCLELLGMLSILDPKSHVCNELLGMLSMPTLTPGVCNVLLGMLSILTSCMRSLYSGCLSTVGSSTSKTVTRIGHARSNRMRVDPTSVLLHNEAWCKQN